MVAAAGVSDAGRLNRRVRPSPGLHAVDRMLSLLEHLDIPILRDMRLYAPPDAENPIPTDARHSKIAVVAPGAIWPPT